MRSKILAAGFILAMLMLLPRNSQAVAVHAFECKTCHIAGVSFTDLTAQVCRQCHDNPTQMHTFSTGQTVQPGVGMMRQDASNLFGHGVSGGMQTSHNWAAPTDVVPEAGAQAPSTAITGFYSRYGTSVGKVTCTRCHNPHGDTTNPKLMPVGVNSTNELCLDCHVGFNNGTTDHGLHGHPVGMNYNAAVLGNPAYKATPDNGATNGGVSLLADGTVSCTSCHGVHFTDSNASTTDQFQSPETATGDGLLLKHNGPGLENPNAGVQGICQTCHNYMGHGKSGSKIGCMVCHGGHEYDANGNPNYYMLRKQITLNIDPNTGTALGTPMTVNLNYTTLDPNYSSGGANGSLCLDCHGTLPAGHSATDQCADCHSHNQATGSFGAGCGSCHGFAPSLNADGSVTSGGYAHSTANPTHNYSTNGAFKAEDATPHSSHANGAGNYTFTCAECHGNGAGNLSDTANHDAGSFQQVLDKGIGTLPVLTTQGNATNATVLVPNYNTAGSGTCTAVYCHSNGEPRGGTTQTVAVSWAGGKNSIVGQPGECQQCHGNDAATMASKGNSAGHQKHLGGGGANNLLGKTFSCAVCHSATASDANTLVASAIGTTHVNGDKDIVSDLTAAGLTGTIAYASDGTCQNTYCHSDGKGNYKTPDWDLANNGVKTSCTLCHNNGTNDGQVVNAAPNTGAHKRHVIDADGPQLSCDVCHGTNASTGNLAQHINGSIDTVANLQTAVCDVCHGASTGVSTGNDREPNWVDSTSVDCATCHQGVLAVIGGKTAPGKNSFTTTGHGLASGSYGTSNNPAANKGCLDCHTNAADTLHINGTTGDTTRLQAGFSCDTCHGASGTASSNGINTHHANACTNCHDPHGSSNIYMVKASSPGNFSGTVAFTALTGTDSFDEADSANGDDLCATCHTATLHNRADATGPTHHEGENCLTCHLPHTNSPSAFAVGGGDSCDSCHGYPPATGAHLLHAPDSAALDTAGKVYRDATNGYADVTACTYCHANADKYTYNPSADQVAGYNHSNATNRPSQMTGIGYDQATATCSAACHNGTSGVTAKWSDTTIGCNACHYESGTPTAAANSADANPLSGNHGNHFTAGAVCTDCHGTLPTDLTHITNTDGATELAKVQGMAKAVSYEATLSAAALGSSGVDPTAAGTNASCNNTACHNPSGGAYSATWTVSTASCNLCHSTTDPGTGSHTKHMNAATNFGINTIACTSCHVDNGTNYAHRDGVVTFAAGITYSAGANDVGGSVGTCSTSSCHNDGTAAATPVVTPTWGNVPADACNICHASTPTSNKHSQHLGDTNYVTSSCATCHTSPTAATHINGTRNLTGSITSATLAANGTCANTCHTVVDGRDWTSGTALACADCHAAGAGHSLWVASGSGTWPPSSNKHSQHLGSNALPQASPNDCFACHDTTVDSAGALKASGTHLNLTAGDVAFNANYNYENLTAGTTGSGAATTCSNIRCHDGATTPAWSAASSISCGQCHGNGSGPLPTGTTAGSHANHANNDTTYTDCARCHNGADTYTATGGSTNHQNLVVNVGATAAFSTLAYTDANGAAGVNYGGDGVDNGTCANSCHGAAASPAWGSAATVTCTSCHNNGTDDGNILNAVPAATAGVHTTHTGANNAYVPNDCEACHGAGANTAAYATNINHTNGTVNFGTDLSTYNASTGTCSNTCHNVVDGRDWTSAKTAGLDLNCSDCHGSGKSLDYSTAPPTSGSHANHVATMDSVYGSLARKSDATGYDFACGQCHGTTAANHLNASVDFDPSVGYTGGTTGTCGTNLCHQDGNGGAPAATPTWGTAFTGDLCAKCHGNSPSSGAHSVHVVGIHAEDLYTGTTGLQTPGTTGADSHGNATYSTTINCNSCHFNTVTSWYDALNPACASCHDTSNTSLGDNALAVTGYDYHVNGVKDIAFQNINIKSRAQLRDDITSVTDLNNTWTRNGSYKASGSYDQAKASLNTATYTSGTQTCSSVACHNGNDATWATPQNNCQACHTGLPK